MATNPFEAINPFDLGRTNPTAGFRLLDPNSPFSSSVVRDFGQILACSTLTLEDPNREHLTPLMRLVGWPTFQSPWTSIMLEPHQIEDEEEDPPGTIGTTEDLVATPGATQPRLIPAIPLKQFASTVDSQDTLLGIVPNDEEEDETKPTTPT
jgi:hypothetical protein